MDHKNSLFHLIVPLLAGALIIAVVIIYLAVYH